MSDRSEDSSLLIGRLLLSLAGQALVSVSGELPAARVGDELGHTARAHAALEQFPDRYMLRVAADWAVLPSDGHPHAPLLLSTVKLVRLQTNFLAPPRSNWGRPLPPETTIRGVLSAYSCFTLRPPRSSPSSLLPTGPTFFCSGMDERSAQRGRRRGR